MNYRNLAKIVNNREIRPKGFESYDRFISTIIVRIKE